MSDLESLSGPELVATYNTLAESAPGKELGLRTVTKFATREAGVARIERARSSIKARKEGLKMKDDEDNTDAPKKKGRAKGSTVVPKGAKKTESVFGAITAGSNREKLLNRLLADEGREIPLAELLAAVYGAPNAPTAPLMMVFKGLDTLIAARKLPFEIKKVRDGKEFRFALTHT